MSAKRATRGRVRLGPLRKTLIGLEGMPTEEILGWLRSTFPTILLGTPDQVIEAISPYAAAGAEEMILQGERKSTKIIEAISTNISNKEIKIDYVSVVVSETMEDLDVIKDEALIAIAAFVGKTRLVDNLLIEV